MRQAWGQDSVGYYSADTFNEQSPPSAEPAYLRNASRGVYEVLDSSKPGCTCRTPHQTISKRRLAAIEICSLQPKSQKNQALEPTQISEMPMIPPNDASAWNRAHVQDVGVPYVSCNGIPVDGFDGR